MTDINETKNPQTESEQLLDEEFTELERQEFKDVEELCTKMRDLIVEATEKNLKRENAIVGKTWLTEMEERRKYNFNIVKYNELQQKIRCDIRRAMEEKHTKDFKEIEE